MDFSNLITKPEIKYTPERVELEPPAEIDPQGHEPVTRVDIPDVLEDTKQALIDEIAELEALLLAVVSALPPLEVPVPDDYADLLDKKTVTMSDYLESLGDEEYGPVAIREVFEEHIEDCDPGYRTIPLIESVMRGLKSDLEHTADSMFKGNIDPTGISDAMLAAMRDDVAEAQQFRLEITRAAHIARMAIDKAVWAHVIDKGTAEKLRTEGVNLARTLKRVKSLLKMSAALYSTDWKSAVGGLRNHLQNALMDKYLNKMISTYSRSYNKVVVPAEKVVSIFSDPAVQDVPEIQTLRNLIARPTEHIRKTTADVVADIYAIRRKRSEIQLTGARSVGALTYTWRLTNQLDSVIAALGQIGGSGDYYLEADAPQGALGQLLEKDQIPPLPPDVPVLADEVFKLTAEPGTK